MDWFTDDVVVDARLRRLRSIAQRCAGCVADISSHHPAHGADATPDVGPTVAAAGLTLANSLAAAAMVLTSDPAGANALTVGLAAVLGLLLATAQIALAADLAQRMVTRAVLDGPADPIATTELLTLGGMGAATLWVVDRWVVGHGSIDSPASAQVLGAVLGLEAFAATFLLLRRALDHCRAMDRDALLRASAFRYVVRARHCLERANDTMDVHAERPHRRLIIADIARTVGTAEDIFDRRFGVGSPDPDDLDLAG